MKTAHLAEAFGMNYEIHHGGNSLNNWANLHVILAIKNLIAGHAIGFFFVLYIALRLGYRVNDSAIIATVSEHR